MTITQLPNGYVFVPREDWGAKFSPGRTVQKKPVSDVFIHHSVSALSGPETEAYDAQLDPSDDPCKDMRMVEAILQQRGLAPGYSYTIHPSGVVLEGAGEMVGAHTGGHNSTGKGICFLGRFDTHQPTLAALVAAARTINILRLDGALVPDLANIRILGHRDVKSTACPGANVYNNINWIRWFAGTNA